MVVSQTIKESTNTKEMGQNAIDTLNKMISGDSIPIDKNSRAFAFYLELANNPQRIRELKTVLNLALAILFRLVSLSESEVLKQE